VRRVIVSEFMSLDGVIEDPGGAEGFERGGWTFQANRGPEGDKFKFDELAAADALLLGRVTYESFAAVWPQMEEQTGDYGARMNGYPKHVASMTLEEPLGWNNSTIMKGDISGEVSRLKQQDGKDILVFGSGELARTLMEHDLILLGGYHPRRPVRLHDELRRRRRLALRDRIRRFAVAGGCYGRHLGRRHAGAAR
jgi:dihydrofolate reductase